MIIFKGSPILIINLVYHVIGTKKKRGPVTGKALEKIMGTVGRIVINTDGDGHIVSGGKSRTYSGRVGALIRDRALCCGQTGARSRWRLRTWSTT